LTKRNPNRPDEILDAAASLFAVRPFHEVRLEDIAAQARVGKGTVYLYWTSKEEVYLDIIRRGFADLLERLDLELGAHHGDVWDKLGAVVTGLVDFAFKYPGVYRIMRSGTITPEDPELQHVRAALSERVCAVLHGGISAGTLTDPCPALTTQYILSFVRGAMLYPPPGMTPDALKAHMMHVLRRGIAQGVAR
jgi:AcrR family transcriptional regulator